MKTEKSILLVALVVLAGFAIYETLPSREGDPVANEQASVSTVVEQQEETPVEAKVVEEQEEKEQVRIESTIGIGKELDSILEGFEAINSEIESLNESNSTSTEGN